MHADNSGLKDISRLIIRGAFTVVNVLGAGFRGQLYENALAHELRMAGLGVEQQRGQYPKMVSSPALMWRI